MSLLDIARDALKDLPVSDILRERLSLALDLASQAEAKHEETKAQLARVEVQLQMECLNHKETQKELQRFKDEHVEEIRIHRLIEFRLGKRTGGKWLAFCPKCHLPAGDGEATGGGSVVYCTAKHADCGWSVYPKISMPQILQEIAV